MSDRAVRIMLVEPDAELLEMFVAALARRFDARITCVADAETALDTDLVEPHDLVIVEQSASNNGGLGLAERLCALSRRPVVLLCDDCTGEDAVRALRVGVCDVFIKPFAVAELLDAAQRALQAFETRRQSAVKYRRMREMVRRVIRERRDLNRRIDLVCRDLVEAHRRLAHRFVELHQAPSGQPAA